MDEPGTPEPIGNTDADSVQTGAMLGSGILSGIRVLDLADGIAGSVAALLLAESGADVVKVEPPGGCASRGLPGFVTWNRSKRSVTIDLAGPAGLASLNTLLAHADVIIHELSPARAAAAGLGDGELAQRYPQLVTASVLGWPANHPDAERPVDELLTMARLGICDEQLPMGREGPVYIRFPLGTWGAAYLAASGIAARLLVRHHTGTGGPAHTSLVQGALVPMGMHWSRAQRPSAPLAEGMSKESRGSQATLLECADGVWVHLMKSPDTSPLMQAALAGMGEQEVAAANGQRPAFNAAYPNLGANAVAMRTLPSAQWLEDFWANDIPAQPALPFGAIFSDPQARANGYVIEVDQPGLGRLTVPGFPLTISPPQRLQGPAPSAGEHTEAVLAQWAASGDGADAGAQAASSARAGATGPGAAATTPGGRARRSPRLPLDGYRVLDLGNYLAGPYAPMLLADLGADVVKVESTAGDAMRPTGWAFAGCQRGKRGVALDLKAPDSRPALEELVRRADVVHHNLRMPAARRLGLDYTTLQPLNPQMVYCHTSSYGPRGPQADWPGYDQLFQAQCGWEVLGAGETNAPMWHRFGFMDHQCALSSVVATLLALYHRERTGQGQAVAGSLLGAGVLTASETYVGPDGALAPFETLDAGQLGTGPGHRLIQLADGWAAVAAATGPQLAALCAVAGCSDPGQVPSALRRRRRAEVVAALSAQGVPAEEVREAQRYPFFDDTANRAAGLVATYQHVEWGRLEQPGAMWWFGDLGVRLDYAPPALGEHTAEVLAEIGLSSDDISKLVDKGAALVR